MNSNTSSITLLKRFFNILSSKRKKQFITLILLMTISNFFEFVSIASIYPFVGSIADPEFFSKNQFVNYLTNFFYIDSHFQLITLFAIIIILLTVISSCLKTFSLWMIARMSGLMASDLSIKSYKNLLNIPLSEFYKLESSDIFVKIENTGQIAGGILQPLCVLINAAILTFVISIGLLITSAKVFTSCLFIILIISFFTNRISRFRIKTLGSKIVEVNSKRIQTVQNSLGSFKDIKINFLEEYFSEKYIFLEREVRKLWSNSIAYTTLPKNILEATGIMLLCLTSIILISSSNFSKAVPIIALILLSIQKLLPSIQQILSSIVIIRNNNKALFDLLEIFNLKNEVKFQTFDYSKLNLDKISPLESLEIKNLYFKYKNTSKYIIDDFSYTFKPNDFITIVGSSGCGKTTLIDLILGLLKYNSGIIKINGNKINLKKNETLIEYRSRFAHVPQNVFLTSGTVKENICLGLDQKKVDYDKLEKSIEMSCLKETLRNMNNGLNTILGENGALISGGQKQRIGIARALYRDFDILVLDESTSAIDEKTQLQIINNLINNYKNKVILHITHRISSIPENSKIIQL